MMKMTRFRDPGSASRAPSSFASFAADMNLANRRISSHQINVDFYEVDVQCSGSLGVTGGRGSGLQGRRECSQQPGLLHQPRGKNVGGQVREGQAVLPN